jgi:hypothetical protein
VIFLDTLRLENDMSDRSLQEIVTQICEQLSREKTLITVKSVYNRIVHFGDWSEEILDNELPDYITNWRLAKLSRE